MKEPSHVTRENNNPSHPKDEAKRINIYIKREREKGLAISEKVTLIPIFSIF